MDNSILLRDIKPDIIIDSRNPSCCSGPDMEYLSCATECLTVYGSGK